MKTIALIALALLFAACCPTDSYAADNDRPPKVPGADYVKDGQHALLQMNDRCYDKPDPRSRDICICLVRLAAQTTSGRAYTGHHTWHPGSCRAEDNR